MIIFFDKTTGIITGTVIGRIHTEDQKKMVIGEIDKTDKIIVDWIPFKWYREDGVEVPENDPTIYTADYKPDSEQPDIFIELDKDPSKVNEYTVDLTTLKLIHR